MIRIEQDRLLVAGPLTLATVAELAAAPLDTQTTVRIIDLGQVGKVDSAAVALLLHWRRQASPQQPLAFVNVPKDLHSLAALYDVADILSLPPKGQPQL